MVPRAVDKWWRKVAGEVINRSWEQIRSLGALHPDSHRSARFGHLGRGSLIAFPVTALYGERWMRIGNDTLFGPWVTLTAGYSPDQPDVPDPALVVGDRCVIGARCGIIAHHRIEIGNDVWMGEDVFVTDANHGYEELTEPIGRQLADAEPVSIGDQSWLGHGAIVLAGVRMGRHVVVAAGSVVKDDVPDNCVVAGVPARVVRKLDLSGRWSRVDGRSPAADAGPAGRPA